MSRPSVIVSLMLPGLCKKAKNFFLLCCFALLNAILKQGTSLKKRNKEVNLKGCNKNEILVCLLLLSFVSIEECLPVLQMFSPPKNSDLTVLRFTPIEEQFYRETLSNCRMKGSFFSAKN